MKLFFSILMAFSLASCIPSFADTLSGVKDAQFGLNQGSPNMLQKHQLGTKVMLEKVHVTKAIYDFAVLGGAVGTKILRGVDGQPVVLPNKAVIVNCTLQVITDGAGAGTIAIGTGQATNDLKAAANATDYDTGLMACIPVGTAATSILLTADRTMTATIATGVTQGKFAVIVQYVIGE